MSRSTNASPSGQGLVTDVVGTIFDTQTYKNIAYLVLAFPLGLLYFIAMTVGFSLGVGLLVVGIGLGILLGTVMTLREVADFERRLANRLLGTEIPEPNDMTDGGDGFVGMVRAYLQASSTWRSVGFVGLKFFLGVASFVLLLTSLGTALELLFLPVFPDGVLNVEINGVQVAEWFGRSVGEVFAVPIGAALALVSLFVLNAFARVNATIATALLGPS